MRNLLERLIALLRRLQAGVGAATSTTDLSSLVLPSSYLSLVIGVEAFYLPFLAD